jgi:hypothetical protein
MKSDTGFAPSGEEPGRVLDSEHRYELKFLIDGDTKKRMLEASEQGLEPDAHGQEGTYLITSQYFDTIDREAFWEKMDGVAFRRKYRLRFYGANYREASAFFEIKHRWDQTVYKERVPLLPGSVESLVNDPAALSGLEEFTPPLTTPQKRTLNSILRDTRRKALIGSNVIAYRRQALVGRYDHRLRLTFDHLCSVRAAGDLEAPGEDRLGTPILPLNTVLMEVKFNLSMPIWLKDCLTRVKLRPVRFSKYAEGVLALDQLLPGS